MTATLAKFLNEIITSSIISQYTLISNQQFYTDIRKIKINQDDMLFSLDIVNLFTTIPIDFTLNLIKIKLDNDDDLCKRTNFSSNYLVKLIKLCMENTSFSFNGEYYKQKSGAAMGCNLSPIVAEALVSHIFELAINSFQIKPTYIKFYVDDSFIVMNRNYVDHFYSHINKIGNDLKSIQFTIEKEQFGRISFLDVKIIKRHNKLYTGVYNKHTHSNRHLNFNSHHPFNNNIAVIRNMISRS